MKSPRFKIFVFLVSLFSASIAHSQVDIQLTTVGGFQFRSVDVLNFTLISGLSESVAVEYHIAIRAAGGKSVVEMVSQPYQVNAGANVYYAHNFNIKSKVYLDQAVQNVERRTGYLPSGDYEYCISVRCIDEEDVCKRFFAAENAPSACGTLHTEPISPLLLSFPGNEDTIPDLRPTFSWIPPMPIGADPSISYGLRLVHLTGDRSPEDQLNRGRPLYEQFGIKDINLLYPNQLQDLERGETYAWRVVANLGDKEVARSEVWTFTVETIPEPIKYVQLLDKPGGGHVSQPTGQDIYFIYDGRYGYEDMSYELFDEQGNLISVAIEKDDLLRPPNWQEDGVYGKNTYVLKITELNLSSGIYTFILSDRRGKKHYLRFKIV